MKENFSTSTELDIIKCNKCKREFAYMMFNRGDIDKNSGERDCGWWLMAKSDYCPFCGALISK